MTVLLDRVVRGEAGAEEHLYRLVYGELHRLAEGRMTRERSAHTLDATELVHEVYLKVRGAVGEGWPNRRAFYGMATEAMRRVLIDHARRRLSDRRARDRQVPLGTTVLAACGALEEASLLRLEEHLVVLADKDPRAEEIVRLHLFAGLETDAIGALLELHLRTVQRDLRRALGFLQAELGDG